MASKLGFAVAEDRRGPVRHRGGLEAVTSTRVAA